MIKHPTKLETEVPNGKEIILLFEYLVIKNLSELPIPPPKKTRITDFKSKSIKLIKFNLVYQKILNTK